MKLIHYIKRKPIISAVLVATVLLSLNRISQTGSVSWSSLVISFFVSAYLFGDIQKGINVRIIKPGALF
jgi:hypothetical protein